MNVVCQNKNNIELTYRVFGPLPCQVEEHLRSLHRPAFLKVGAVVVGEAGGGEYGDLLATHN